MQLLSVSGIDCMTSESTNTSGRKDW